MIASQVVLGAVVFFVDRKILLYSGQRIRAGKIKPRSVRNDIWRVYSMALEGFYVVRQERQQIASFLETWHYSRSINGCIADFCYGLFNPKGGMVGALFFGRMAMANQWRRFSDSANDVIELRRLALIDDTPKNAESFFIAKALKMLKAEWGGKIVVSYADKEQGHTGTIYKAANFIQLKDIPGAKIIIYGGKKYHDKAVRTRYKGELKPFAKQLILALENGDAQYRKTAGKHTFIYELRGGGRRKGGC